jgi:hypothetical protein
MENFGNGQSLDTATKESIGLRENTFAKKIITIGDL